jgi:hypothetical protein
MATEPRLGPIPLGQQEDVRRALLDRIAHSPAFQKSNRLRELLLFLGEHALTQSDLPIREQEIGVGVFGREANYDTSQDTLVRVQASHLRKKLQQYFEEEGKAEPLLVEIPKGSYTLIFQRRAEPEILLAPIETPFRRRPTLILGILSFLLLAACGWLAIQNADLRRKTEFGMGPKPEVDRLWRQLFDNGRHTYIVLADGNLVVLEDNIKRDISLQDYENRAFERLATRYIEDADRRTLVLNVVGRHYTSMADARIAQRMGLLFASNGAVLESVLSRDLSLQQTASHNTILLGSRRANPWVTLYEDKLNFQTVFEETPRVAYFRNNNPRAGEPAEYRGQWSKLGFCRVAYLPSSKGAGNVVLISGTDVPSTEAGGEFFTGENSIRELRRALGVSGSEPLPHFEVLLQAQLISGGVAQFHVVATRRR